MRNLSDITVAILAGGLGTRLEKVLPGRQKVIAEVSGRPFLTYLLDQASAAGAREVILCAGYGANEMKKELGTRYGSLRLEYSVEDEPFGTGGALALAEQYFSSDTVMVMNGDSYIDVDLTVYVNWYGLECREAAILLTKVDDTARFGKIDIAENGRITAFKEKGTFSGEGLINAGIYFIRRDIIASFPQGEPYSLEYDFFPSFIGKGLFGFRSKARFIDIGTPESYAEAEDFFKTTNH